MAHDMTRRTWLTAVAGAALTACSPRGLSAAQEKRTIQTVTGPISADALGVTLMHEHVLVDFVGAADVSRSRYDADAVFRRALPYLKVVQSLGCATFVECTPPFLGRDVQLLKRLSEASGLRIISNTGFYGAAKDKHVPPFAYKETAEQLAGRWIDEAVTGIEDTGIKPGFMKIGVDDAPLSEIDIKLVKAAAITHRATGLTIASHTGSGAAAIEQLDILDAAGVNPAGFIWVHAQSERDAVLHVRAARRGAWVEFDGVSPASIDRHVEVVAHMKSERLLDRVLVSHDAGWYRVGEPNGGSFRPFTTVFTAFVPALKAKGLTDADVRQLLVDNPRRALSGAE
jgi:phosphotriesterase-related protein